MPITAFYASLLVPLFVVLAVRVIQGRVSEKVGVGDGGKANLLRRIRAHGNFAEYAPFALLMLALAESLNSKTWLLHACGAALVAGRVCHAFGISQSPERMIFRQAGMAATFTVLGVLALTCLLGAARQF